MGAEGLSIDNNAETDLELEDLTQILLAVEPIRYTHDGFSWTGGDMGEFSVSFYYKQLMLALNEEKVDPSHKEALKHVWRSWLPSKVKIFGWRLLKDRLATRAQLVKRGILEYNAAGFCAFGCLQIEDTAHLFINCETSRRVWENIAIWLGIEPLGGDDCCSHFLVFLVRLRNKGSLRRIVGIWMGICWSIWQQRNTIIFMDGVRDCEEILYNAKRCSWFWLAIGNKLKRQCCYVYAVGGLLVVLL
ncbi:uncharacterized protein LOC131651385 [Vicia villosa]|uniref:uncharacterized protein LOC131651385 n=1 Tax=Vicia villosa TaxID=3911 RepID=UPI00273B4D1F|nr:uncharacterized protein LOC131651385 [Vicia villosa]